jgi:hypothetical protein
MAKKAKTLDGTIIDCMDGVFAEWFPGDTWMSWRSILKAAFALPEAAPRAPQDFFLLPRRPFFVRSRYKITTA